MDNLKDQKGIFCQYHPLHKASFIKVSEENIVELKCDECILEESSFKDLISIQTIQSYQENHIITNWPPLLDNKELLTNFKACLQINSQIIGQIELYFDKITKDITSYLASEKKNMIQQAISLIDHAHIITQSYQKQFDIKKLKKLVNFNEEDIQSQIKKLKNFVSKWLRQKDKSIQFLQEQLNKIYQEQIHSFDFQKIQKTTKQQIDKFIEQLQQITPFNQSLDISQLFSKIVNKDSSVIQCKQDLLNISIKKIKNNGSGQFYFNYNLTKDKQYIVRFKFNDDGGNCVKIGLLNKSNLRDTLQNNHLAKVFGHQYSSYSSKIVRGSLMQTVEKDFIVEMRINIKEQKLQFLDYPNYQSINELNDEYTLNQNDTYHLAIQFISNWQYITSFDLIYFQEIEC